MTNNGIVILIYIALIALIALIATACWVMAGLEDWTTKWRETRHAPETVDMLDEYARLAIARESRESKATNTRYHSQYSAEVQIREFLKRSPHLQLVELEKARKHEYVHTTATEMMLKHDPVRSAAYIAKLEADVYPQPKRRRPNPRRILKG